MSVCCSFVNMVMHPYMSAWCGNQRAAFTKNADKYKAHVAAIEVRLWICLLVYHEVTSWYTIHYFRYTMVCLLVYHVVNHAVYLPLLVVYHWCTAWYTLH